MWYRPGHAPAAYLGSRPSSDSLQVQPGPSWRGLLLTPGAPPSWLQALLSHLQGRPDTALAQQARQLVVSLLSVLIKKESFVSYFWYPKKNSVSHSCGACSVLLAVVMLARVVLMLVLAVVLLPVTVMLFTSCTCDAQL